MEPWLNTALTWIGAVGGFLGGAAGLAGAWVAVTSAREAKLEARASREQAEQSTALMAEAVETADSTKLIAGDARDLAIQSNDLADKSNVIATEAKSIAEEATEIARRREQRATEVHDVDWVYEMTDPGKLEFRNDGRHTAFEVHLVVYVNGEKATADLSEVSGGEVVDLDFPQLGDAIVHLIQDEVAKRVQKHHQQAHAAAYLQSPIIPYGMEGMFRVDWRVQWLSEQGTPREQSNSDLDYLGDLDPYEDTIETLVDRQLG
ncbi:hypothetical protein [Rhodococcus sp. SJ-3]|uniref:hypothetical protein n=1 Tax=Rhodococcus sp. SJ-3 TaxID=3454628 RepID=UPI003F794BF6